MNIFDPDQNQDICTHLVKDFQSKTRITVWILFEEENFDCCSFRKNSSLVFVKQSFWIGFKSIRFSTLIFSQLEFYKYSCSLSNRYFAVEKRKLTKFSDVEDDVFILTLRRKSFSSLHADVCRTRKNEFVSFSKVKQVNRYEFFSRCSSL
jgi:hypothetical protein